MTLDLLRADAVGQAAAVRTGEVSPAELVEAAAARAEAVDALETPLFEQALEAELTGSPAA